MADFSEFKKLFFGVKAVSKSAANKTAEAGKEKVDDLSERAEELFGEAKHKAEDLSGKMTEKAGETFQKAKYMAEDLGNTVSGKAEETLNKAKDLFGDWGETIKDKTEGTREKAKATTENVGKTILDKTEGVRGKAAQASEEVGKTILDTSEKVGEEVLNKTGDLWNKTKNLAEGIGASLLGTTGKKEDTSGDFFDNPDNPFAEKKESPRPETTTRTHTSTESTFSADDFAKDFANSAFDTDDNMAKQAKAKVDKETTMDDMLNKAKDMSGKLSDTLESKWEELTRKAEAAAEEETAAYDNPKMGYDNAKGSTLDGQDDFFAKADRFARGDYHNKGKNTSSSSSKVGGMKISQDPNYKEKPKTGTIPGFEDLDGDGDELIDDAIILDDD